MWREGNACAQALIDDPPGTCYAAHAGEIDPHHIDGLGHQQRLRIIRPALLIAHCNGCVDGLTQPRKLLGIARWEDILEPSKRDIGDFVGEIRSLRDIIEHPGAVATKPRTRCRRPRRPQSRGRGFQRWSNRRLEPAPTRSREVAHLLSDFRGSDDRRRIANDGGYRHRLVAAAEELGDGKPSDPCRQIPHCEIDDR